MKIEVIDKDGNVIYCEDEEKLRERRKERIKNGVRDVRDLAITVGLNAIPVLALGCIAKGLADFIRK